MNTRQIALAGTLLAIVFIAHFAARFIQFGVIQLAPSIAIYTLMALILAPQLGWIPLVGVGFATGILTTLATTSPFPLANIPAHGLGFLLAAGLARSFGSRTAELSTANIVAIVTATVLVSWFLFATVSWFGLVAAGHPATQRPYEILGMQLGQGIVAFWAFTFVAAAIPTWIIGLILTPLLYRAVRPALVRQGMIPATGPGA